jgi:hypothetical protein
MLQIVRIAPLRAANIVAALYLVLFGAFALIFAPFTGTVPVSPNVDPQQQESLRTMFRWMLIGYPVLAAISGWLFALIGAAIYNVLAPRIGGFTIETQECA